MGHLSGGRSANPDSNDRATSSGTNMNNIQVVLKWGSIHVEGQLYKIVLQDSTGGVVKAQEVIHHQQASCLPVPFLLLSVADNPIPPRVACIRSAEKSRKRTDSKSLLLMPLHHSAFRASASRTFCVPLWASRKNQRRGSTRHSTRFSLLFLSNAAVLWFRHPKIVVAPKVLE